MKISLKEDMTVKLRRQTSLLLTTIQSVKTEDHCFGSYFFIQWFVKFAFSYVWKYVVTPIRPFIPGPGVLAHVILAIVYMYKALAKRLTYSLVSHDETKDFFTDQMKK